MVGAAGTAKDSKNTPDYKLRLFMYEEQVVNGVFQAGPKCNYTPARLQEQAKCKHPFDMLSWGANK